MNDALIEAVASLLRASYCGHEGRNPDSIPDDEDRHVARAALAVIAPAVLESAIDAADAETYSDRMVKAAELDGNSSLSFYNQACSDIAISIRALKARYV